MMTMVAVELLRITVLFVETVISVADQVELANRQHRLAGVAVFVEQDKLAVGVKFMPEAIAAFALESVALLLDKFKRGGFTCVRLPAVYPPVAFLVSLAAFQQVLEEGVVPCHDNPPGVLATTAGLCQRLVFHVRQAWWNLNPDCLAAHKRQL